MPLVASPALPNHGQARRVVKITCRSCEARMVVATDGQRLARLVPRLERVHSCVSGR